jgi:minor histocompatibility antigen H13
LPQTIVLEGEAKVELVYKLSIVTFSEYPPAKHAQWWVYGLLFSFWAFSSVVVIPVPVNLVVTASSVVYIGCYRSLRLLDHTDEFAGERETLTKEDAYKFPVIGSIVLGSLYLAFKFLDKDMLNLVLAGYFCLLGVYTLFSTISPLFARALPGPKVINAHYKLPLLGAVDISLSVSDIICLMLNVALAVLYFFTKHFMLNNILGISFCIQGIERMSIGSYKIGAILLCGLFFYDVFWVFGTDVMVTVAKSFDGPIKLLFPREFGSDTVNGKLFQALASILGLTVSTGSKNSFSMLGLGDIVIPGIFVALLLRFDCVQARADVRKAASLAFPMPYFYANIVGYILGLVATVTIMYVFNAAQPALLYLVPACLIASILVGAVKKELGDLFAYEEESTPLSAETAAKAKTA